MKATKYLKKMGLVLILATVAGLFLPSHGLTQDDGSQIYFPETEHTVKEPFANYFEEHGGLELFGYPITEAFEEQGVKVQYFQKIRMEHHPENSEDYQVQLGLLGDELKYRQPPIESPGITSRRRIYYDETGHTVAYAFLDFFRQNGGIDIFGYPITEMHFEEGRIVQYFQRLKLEWHPEDRTSPVKVGNLGEIYVNAYRERIPADALRRVDRQIETGTFAPATAVTNIRAVISLRYSVMGKQGNQIVSVLATDDNGEPLKGAFVAIRLTNTSGKQLSDDAYDNLTTDERGFARASIPVNGGQTGSRVIVQADVKYGGASTTAKNVFLLWW